MDICLSGCPTGSASSRLVSAAVTGIHATKHDYPQTVQAVVATLGTWEHTGVVLHADGEPSTRAVVRSVAAAREHRTLTRHGAPHSHQSQGPVEACIGVYRGTLDASKLQLFNLSLCCTWSSTKQHVDPSMTDTVDAERSSRQRLHSISTTV